MNFCSSTGIKLTNINKHASTPLEILKFHKHITCGISPGDKSTDNGQDLTVHEENEVVHIWTHFISCSHTVKRGPIMMTVLAKVEKIGRVAVNLTVKFVSKNVLIAIFRIVFSSMQRLNVSVAFVVIHTNYCFGLIRLVSDRTIMGVRRYQTLSENTIHPT